MTALALHAGVRELTAAEMESVAGADFGTTVITGGLGALGGWAGAELGAEWGASAGFALGGPVGLVAGAVLGAGVGWLVAVDLGFAG